MFPKDKMVKKAIEKFYDGVCDIWEYRPVTDSYGITRHEEVKVSEEIPCRISYRNFPASVQQEGNKIQQEIKLFLNPEIEIKAGSKLVITQNGITRGYKNSGVSAAYTSHQEILLELFRGWA